MKGKNFIFERTVMALLESRMTSSSINESPFRLEKIIIFLSFRGLSKGLRLIYEEARPLVTHCKILNGHLSSLFIGIRQIRGIVQVYTYKTNT